MPARLPPHASLRLGMIDLEARPCPPGPTAPATQTARDVGARPPCACRPQLEVVVWCLCFVCLRARPPARSPHASLRLGVVDLEARPCPPDPPAPSTPAAPARCVVRRVASRHGLAASRPIGTAARFRWGRPVVMCCASSQLRARGENVYAGGRSSA